MNGIFPLCRRLETPGTNLDPSIPAYGAMLDGINCFKCSSIAVMPLSQLVAVVFSWLDWVLVAGRMLKVGINACRLHAGTNIYFWLSEYPFSFYWLLILWFRAKNVRYRQHNLLTSSALQNSKQSLNLVPRCLRRFHSNIFNRQKFTLWSRRFGHSLKNTY